MGGLTLFVTGAAGYLGQGVVREALGRGHKVRALVRSGTVEGAEVVSGDLHDPALAGWLAKVDAVVHCAAKLSGSDAEMERDTVAGTAALVAAARTAKVKRIVLAGSMSVYGGQSPGDVIDEDARIEPDPGARDAYTRAKLAQEEVVRSAGQPAWILRIGAIWGPGRLWNGHLGVALGPLLLRCGREGDIPLCHVDHAARAMVAAAETAPEGIEVLNILDSDLPDRIDYVAALRAGGWPKLVVPVPWRLLDLVARPGASKLPGLLRRPVLRARLMPLSYSNDRARARLDWEPWMGFEDAMEASR
jgi:nucleoside-diphosphate-sugar epimerase